MLPGNGLIDQRHPGGPTTPEEDGRNGDTLGVLPGVVPSRTVGDRAAEAGVGVGRWGGGGGAPRLAAPVDAALGLLTHPFPPHPPIRGQGHVAVRWGRTRIF